VSYRGDFYKSPGQLALEDTSLNFPDFETDTPLALPKETEITGPREVPSRREYFINMLPSVASRSKDPRHQVACIIVDRDRVMATGYNGFPPDVEDTEDRWNNDKLSFVCHAEANAIAHCARTGTKIEYCTAYCSFAPCLSCAKLLISAGITLVIVDKVHHDRMITDKWAKDQAKVEAMFKEADVKLVWFGGEE
jgi:dCMP deaminase